MYVNNIYYTMHSVLYHMISHDTCYVGYFNLEKELQTLAESEISHEVEPWFHSWYRGRVETLDARYNLIFR